MLDKEYPGDDPGVIDAADRTLSPLAKGLQERAHRGRKILFLYRLAWTPFTDFSVCLFIFHHFIQSDRSPENPVYPDLVENDYGDEDECHNGHDL